MSPTNQNFRRIPFPAIAAGRSFIEQMNVGMRARVDELMGGMIPKENTEVFYHGRTFVYRQEDLSSHESTFETRTVEHELDLESIRTGDLQSLPVFLETITTNFVRQLKQLLFQRAGEAADSVGNTVDARQHTSIAEAYLEMFRRVEFGVDKQGNVSFPELFLHPNTAQRLQEELSKQGADFRQAIQNLTNQKIADALGRERERLSKFKKPGEAK
jgi:hypothetical protein